MDYEKKYKNAVKELKKFFINNDDLVLYKHDIEHVFPELKENEDEIIRKEVDLDKYINKYFKRWYVDLTDQGNILHSPDGQVGLMSVKKVAKHFFELGLKAKQNINIDITNIDKVIEDNGVDPNSKEAKMFKESYYMALEKLKTQKGE